MDSLQYDKGAFVDKNGRALQPEDWNSEEDMEAVRKGKESEAKEAAAKAAAAEARLGAAVHGPRGGISPHISSLEAEYGFMYPT